MPTSTKGGTGGYHGSGRKGRAKQQQRQKEQERDRLKRIEQKADAKCQRSICPSERQAEAKRLLTRQQRKTAKTQEEMNEDNANRDAKTARKLKLDERKEAGRHAGKAASGGNAYLSGFRK